MVNLNFQQSIKFVFATNTFIDTSVILKYENTNLIEINKKLNPGFTIQTLIFHSDGNFLAKVNDARIYPTEEGKKAGLKIEKSLDITILKMNNRILFEIKHKKDNKFKMITELYTPDGSLVKCNDLQIPELIDANGKSINIKEYKSNCIISNVDIGMWIKKDGLCLIGLK